MCQAKLELQVPGTLAEQTLMVGAVRTVQIGITNMLMMKGRANIAGRVPMGAGAPTVRITIIATATAVTSVSGIWRGSISNGTTQNFSIYQTFVVF